MEKVDYFLHLVERTKELVYNTHCFPARKIQSPEISEIWQLQVILAVLAVRFFSEGTVLLLIFQLITAVLCSPYFHSCGEDSSSLSPNPNELKWKGRIINSVQNSLVTGSWAGTGLSPGLLIWGGCLKVNSGSLYYAAKCSSLHCFGPLQLVALPE